MFSSRLGVMMAAVEPAAELLGRASGPPLTIETARPHQTGDLAVLVLDCLAEFERDFPEPVWRAMHADWADVPRRLREAEVLVAHFDGHLAGTVSLHSGTDGRGSWPGGRAEIRVLAVRAGLRRQGIGRALTEECRRRARHLGVEQLVAATPRFMVAARAVLERCGFVRAPQLDLAWSVDGVARSDWVSSVPVLAYVLDV